MIIHDRRFYHQGQDELNISVCSKHTGWKLLAHGFVLDFAELMGQ